MKRIYMDNAATSFPKAPGISETIRKFIENDCVNLNRTNSPESLSVFDRIYTPRESIAELLGLSTPESMCFSSGITESLNQIIKGLFTEKDHVLVSSCEHNSVMRPLIQSRIPFDRIPCDREGYIRTDQIEPLIRKNTKAMIICAAGNVSGAVQDIETIAEIVYKHNIELFLDSAQAVPNVDIDMEKLHIAGVAFTGHKGLLGPEGTGGIALRKDIALTIDPLVSGGTGSQSDREEIPTTLPDRLEAGTQNIPGLLALSESVKFIIKNRDNLLTNERKMTELLYEGLTKIENLKIVGAPLTRPRTSVISITSEKKDIAEISALLSERYNIDTRVGMHCSPSSHKTLGTFPTGTLRLSPGVFTTEDEVRTTLAALKEILSQS